MFKNESSEIVGFKSTWQKKCTEDSHEMQTEPVSENDLETQAPEKCHVEVQTESINESTKEFADYDDTSLAQFLARVVPPLLEELDKSYSSHAFDNYDPFADDDQSNVVSLVKTLVPGNIEQHEVSSLSWNSTGSSIAVAYILGQHEDWCTHDNACVCCWNLDRIKNADKPTALIELEACATSVAYHPLLPSVIAVGDFSGRVMVFNISRDDVDTMVEYSVTKSSDEDESTGHRDPVTSLLWIKTQDMGSLSEYHLVSGSLDGKILIWNVKQKDNTLQVTDGFLILAENFPSSLSRPRLRTGCEVGITSMSSNSEDLSVLIIGTEGGGLFQCNLNSESLAGNSTVSALRLKNPIVFGYSPHNSHNCSSEFSPSCRNIFLSCGYDGQVLLYSLLQVKPLLTLQRDLAVTCVKWSPVRPLLFAITTHDGKVVIYDLSIDRTLPVAEVPNLPEQNKKAPPMTCLQFNQNDPRLLVSGSKDGKVYVWRLSDRLISQGVHEKEILSKIGSETQD